MSITAKELAQKLHLSATAVSMALNNKPGVSTETRRLVIEAAQKYGYDFTRIREKAGKNLQITVVAYKVSNAILSYSPVFDEIMDGIQNECGRQHIRITYRAFLEQQDDMNELLGDIRASDADGVLLIASEMDAVSCRKFDALKKPVVLLDNDFISPHFPCVCIDNQQGAYDAACFLIESRGKQPGYLKSSYPLNNFTARADGFRRALHDHGMSERASVQHLLPPTLEGACMEMAGLLEAKVQLADCYFADNDLIALGAMQAFKRFGYKIPDDIAVVGFDNIAAARVAEPSLTTVSIPRSFMGELAVKNLVSLTENRQSFITKTQISTSLVRRFST
ncbi:MAG: LacI family DNA-binding transcriptional regulator [Lachnospiraceae bacterium]